MNYYNRTRTDLSLTKDAHQHRTVQEPSHGREVEVPRGGGLHHHESLRRAAGADRTNKWRHRLALGSLALGPVIARYGYAIGFAVGAAVGAGGAVSATILWVKARNEDYREP